MKFTKENFFEIIRYGIVGLSTTFVNLGLFHILLFLKLDYKISNLIAIIVAKIFAFVTNKNIVFRSHCNSKKEATLEIIKYVFSRGATGLLDYFGLILLVEVFEFDEVISKYAIQIVVIVINYILGKFVVFTKSKKTI